MLYIFSAIMGFAVGVVFAALWIIPAKIEEAPDAGPDDNDGDEDPRPPVNFFDREYFNQS